MIKALGFEPTALRPMLILIVLLFFRSLCCGDYRSFALYYIVIRCSL